MIFDFLPTVQFPISLFFSTSLPPTPLFFLPPGGKNHKNPILPLFTPSKRDTMASKSENISDKIQAP